MFSEIFDILFKRKTQDDEKPLSLEDAENARASGDAATLLKFAEQTLKTDPKLSLSYFELVFEKTSDDDALQESVLKGIADCVVFLPNGETRMHAALLGITLSLCKAESDYEKILLSREKQMEKKIAQGKALQQTILDTQKIPDSALSEPEPSDEPSVPELLTSAEDRDFRQKAEEAISRRDYEALFDAAVHLKEKAPELSISYLQLVVENTAFGKKLKRSALAEIKECIRGLPEDSYSHARSSLFAINASIDLAKTDVIDLLQKRGNEIQRELDESRRLRGAVSALKMASDPRHTVPHVTVTAAAPASNTSNGETLPAEDFEALLASARETMKDNPEESLSTLMHIVEKNPPLSEVRSSAILDLIECGDLASKDSECDHLNFLFIAAARQDDIKYTVINILCQRETVLLKQIDEEQKVRWEAALPSYFENITAQRTIEVLREHKSDLLRQMMEVRDRRIHIAENVPDCSPSRDLFLAELEKRKSGPFDPDQEVMEIISILNPISKKIEAKRPAELPVCASSPEINTQISL